LGERKEKASQMVFSIGKGLFFVSAILYLLLWLIEAIISSRREFVSRKMALIQRLLLILTIISIGLMITGE